MKAGIYIGKEKITVSEIPMPEIGPDDVLIETICTAVSSEDIEAYVNGPSRALPAKSPFGHQTIGYVIGLGENALDFNLGERVYPMSHYAFSPDEACTMGAFSEYVLIGNASLGRSLFPIPDAITDRMGCLIEPFAQGCHAARCCMKPRSAEELYYILKNDAPCRGDIRYQEGERALVIGGDTTAIAAALMLRWFGMEEVTVCDPSQAHRDMAASFGLHTASSLPQDLTIYDCWLDMVGTPSIVSIFAAGSKANSRLALASVHTEAAVPAMIDPAAFAAEGKLLIGCGNCTPADLDDVIGMMSGGYFDIESMITEEFTIDQLGDALAAASEEDAGQIVVTF